MKRRQFLAIAPLALFLSPARFEPAGEDDTLGLPPDWVFRPRIPARSAEGPLVAALNRAARYGREVRFVYEGGSAPGRARRVVPALVFRVEGYPHVYFTGLCRERGEQRTFRLDRCAGLREV